jgi:hypothetical protein
MSTEQNTEPEQKKEYVNWQRLIITTLLVVVASAITSSLTWFILDRTFSESQQTNNSLVTNLEARITALSKKIEGGAAAVAVVSENGTITGKIMYPSSGIPNKIKIFAEDSKTGKPYEATVTFSDPAKDISATATYSVTVPAGSYYVYGSLADFNDQNGTPWKSYYNQFVVCGLAANCKDVTKVVVNVEATKTVPDITIGDWYPTK